MIPTCMYIRAVYSANSSSSPPCQLLQPIRQRFCSLVERPDLREAGQEWETEHQMLCLLEAICGLAFNSRPALIQVSVTLCLTSADVCV